MSGEIARGFYMNDQGKLDYMQVGSKDSATGSLTESEAAIMAQIEIANALRGIESSLVYIGEQIHSAALIDD